MTREEYLAVCKTCSNRGFDPKLGVISGLTNAPANFEATCPDYTEDEEMLNLEKAREMDHAMSTDTGGDSKDILWGIVWLVGGLALTLSDTGYIFYGAIIYGAFKLIVGLVSLAR